jgi:hypothetical protein
MKEADDDATPPPGPPPAGSDSGNDKLSKDMKGLVYQGESPGGDAPAPDTFPEDEPNIGGAKAKGPEMSAESNTILNFTEKDSRLKAIGLFAIIVVIIIGVGFLVLHSKAITPSKGSSSTTTNQNLYSNAPTTSIPAPNLNKTILQNIDVFFNYTGPASLHNQSCGQSKRSTVSSYSNRLNASQTFTIYDTESTGVCALTITKYIAVTPGFKIVSITPTPTPFTIPGNDSSEYVILTIRAPPFNYTGPLSIAVDEK